MKEILYIVITILTDSTFLARSTLTVNIHCHCYFAVYVYAVIHFYDSVWPILSGIECVRVSFALACLYLYCCWGSQYQIEVGGVPINRLNPVTFVCLS